MNYGELRRWLAKAGCTFETHKGGSGHITVHLKGRTSQLPAHGKGRELGTKLVQKIKKDLGLK
jgi:mRNA interferase HicA